MVNQPDQELSKYQKKTDREHILDNPDTYIGSVELIESNEYILNSETSNIQKKLNLIICTYLIFKKILIHFLLTLI